MSGVCSCVEVVLAVGLLDVVLLEVLDLAGGNLLACDEVLASHSLEAALADAYSIGLISSLSKEQIWGNSQHFLRRLIA